eukprot:TRINITY_DN96569_c0_g1_i1.p1 TRINITY_DN96569_c0_g1~~TRINITY_DN96569_c0_g1_i1.p1  ORF type:complete len:122 (+),score=18.07 TRINITY_DN96569_c0_g1_i1:104-469(+)
MGGCQFKNASYGEFSMFEHDNCYGDRLNVWADGATSKENAKCVNLVPLGWNDKATSYLLGDGTKVAFYEHENCGGREHVVDNKYRYDMEDVNLGVYDMGGSHDVSGWNDTISSVKVWGLSG